MNDGAIAEKLREHVKKTARSVGWVLNGHEISRVCGCSYDDAIQALEALVADGWLTKHYDLLPAEDEDDNAAWTSLSEVDVAEALVSNELYHPDSGESHSRLAQSCDPDLLYDSKGADVVSVANRSAAP